MRKIKHNFALAVAQADQKKTKKKSLETVLGYAYMRDLHPDIARALPERKIAALSAHADSVAESVEKHRQNHIKLRAKKAFQGGVYMGAAGMINLGYIAASRASAAILYDINPLQKLFWQIVIEHLAKFEKREDFLAALPTFPSLLATRLEQINKTSDIQAKLPVVPPRGVLRDTSLYCSFKQWAAERYHKKFSPNLRLCDMGLANDSDYAHLHALAKKQAIGAMTLDIKDEEAVSSLLKKAGPVSVLYTSNILRFIRNETDFAGVKSGASGEQAALENIRRLLNGPGPRHHITERQMLQNQLKVA